MQHAYDAGSFLDIVRNNMSLLKTIQKILFNMYSYICLLTQFYIFN